MLSCFDFIRESTTLAMALRLLLAFICGAVIGAEREIKRRPAGFRTHILICLGAAITTLTSQYLLLGLGLYTDVGRLGAQVIAGIGFIGAGTIIVTKRQRRRTVGLGHRRPCLRRRLRRVRDLRDRGHTLCRDSADKVRV